MFNKQYLFKMFYDNKAHDFKFLAKRMKVPISQNRQFSQFLKELVNNFELFLTNDRRYFKPEILGEEKGEIRLASKGFGFIDFNDISIFILANNINTAMDGDIVRFKYFRDPFKEDSYQGFVFDVIERRKLTFVGRVKKNGTHFTIVPFDSKIKGKFRFEDPSNLIENMEVKVEIINFGHSFLTIKLVKKLGMFDDSSMDIIVAIEDSNVPTEFHQNTLSESMKIPTTIKSESKEGRIDLRNEMIYTIDGNDTKDFDDAISVKLNDNGNYILGVHIADVTHYVKEGSSLDQDAKNRGTSVYLADRVIPMLPEKLSNGICSLNPNVDRFTITCEMEIDQNGNNVNVKVFPSIINSKYRITYKEANEYFGNKNDIWKDKKLTSSLDLSIQLSKIIRIYKEREGYIDFEIEESKIIVDDNGKTIDIVPRERSFSEMLIEDFMVRANESIAKYISDMKLSFIYRIHDKPEFEKINSLRNVMKVLKIDVNIPEVPLPIEFANAVNKIKQTRFDDFMKIMMLRTMSKAIYSKENIGHFGLASKFYTHFTSPIRRYPDLMVHRMLREYLFKKDLNSSQHFNHILPEISKHSSSMEQRAIMLERRVADIKKAEYYEQFIGREFEGTIVSILNFGFFVEFPNKVDGLVHMSTLMGGRFEQVQNGLSISDGKITFTIGDKIKVIVVSTSKTEAKIDLVISSMFEEWQKKQNKN